MTALAQDLLRKYYGGVAHPYQLFEQQVQRLLTTRCVLLDAGCGRTVPVLRKFVGKAQRLIGSQYPNYLMFNGALFFVGMCFERLISRVSALRFLRGWILVTLRKPA
jgi:hypothetical protein